MEAKDYYKVHFILCGKYDVIVAVEGKNEKDAQTNAINEMKEDGLYIEPCTLFQIEYISA